MATIDVTKTHNLGKERARKAAEAVAERLKEKIEVQYQWAGDVLEFQRSGANGRIHVSDSEVRVEVDLGLMLRPMKGMITEKVGDYLNRYLVETPPA